MNKEALKFFKQMSNKKSINANCVKLAHNNDYSDIDAEFIMNYANKDSEILDIGSGTGLMINKICDKVKSIECVEPFKRFSDFIKKAPNISIQNTNIYNYNTDKKFDIITMFGFLHYFNEDEAVSIYKKVKQFLKPEGGGENNSKKPVWSY